MDDISSPSSEFDDAMDALVESGRYRSRQEVLREGVRLVQDRAPRLADYGDRRITLTVHSTHGG